MDQSFESLNSEVIDFLLCAVFWMLKVSLSYDRLAEYSDLHLIYNNAKWFKFTGLFCWHISRKLSVSGLCKFTFRRMLNHGSLPYSRIIFCKVVNKTSFYLASEQFAVRLIRATWNSETVVLVVNRPAGIESEWYFNHYISSDLCEAFNRTGKFQRWS